MRSGLSVHREVPGFAPEDPAAESLIPGGFTPGCTGYPPGYEPVFHKLST
jgi:hypothetical protein